MLLLLSLALSSLGLASANSAVTVVCRTQWQVESADAEGEPVYNVPLVGGQLSWRPVASTYSSTPTLKTSAGRPWYDAPRTTSGAA